MASAVNPRREAINGVFSLYFEAKEKATLKNLRALVKAIQAFIGKSPQAFADLSHAIGLTQDLLLDAAAKAKADKTRKQYFSWDQNLGNARLSRAGQTQPGWLQSGASSTGPILVWRAPSLDKSDEGDESEDDIAPEKLYGKSCEHCGNAEAEPDEPLHSEPIHLDIETDFQD